MPTSLLRTYRQRLVVYVVWHPGLVQGGAIADALYSLLNRDGKNPTARGIGIPVLLRTSSDGSVPRPLAIEEAHHTAVVVLVDDNITVAPGWTEYIEHLWDQAAASDGRHRLYPVKLAEHAFNLSKKIRQVNFMRPLANAIPNLPPGPPDESLMTRLTNAVIHELCRLLLAKPRLDQQKPVALPEDEKVTIFISHTKADGVAIAQAIKEYIQTDLQAHTFFDANDIPYGAQFDPEIRRNIQNGALLVIQTDAYANSTWCLEELLEAKRHRRPILVMHAVAAGEERSPVYAGNVPSRRHDAQRYDRIVGRLLLEVLRREHFIQHFDDLAKLFGIPDDVRPLPYAPEPLTIADLRIAGESATTFVYPDPPLSEGELSRLRVLDQRITVTTPLLLLATEARSTIPGDPTTTSSAGPTPHLRDWTVGLSIGNSPDLERLGMGNEHLNDATVGFASYLLACGANLAYGGIPQLTSSPGELPPPNFLDILLDLGRTHINTDIRGSIEQPQACILNFVAAPFQSQAQPSFLSKWKRVIDYRPVPPDPDAPAPPSNAPDAEKAYYVARSLTAMRRAMNTFTAARVLLGGESFKAQGKYPGIVEEAYLALQGDKPQPVYLIGGFGGAAQAVTQALQGRQTDVLTRAAQETADAGYRAMAAVFDREAAGGRTEPLDYDGIAGFFRTKGVSYLSQINGLSVEENVRLFETPHVIEMVYLVLTGLSRLPIPNRKAFHE